MEKWEIAESVVRLLKTNRMDPAHRLLLEILQAPPGDDTVICYAKSLFKSLE